MRQRVPHQLSPEEYAARIREQQRQNADHIPIDESILWARRIRDNLHDHPALQDLEPHGAGVCDDCSADWRRENHNDPRPARDVVPPVYQRFQCGVFVLCRHHALQRLHAADQPASSSTVVEPPVNLVGWAKTAGRRLTERAILALLDDWRIEGAEREKALKITRHVRAQLQGRAA